MKVLASIAQEQDAVSKAYVDALFSGYIANKANQLATARNIWGQSFDGTKDITGVASFDKGIEIKAGQSIAFIDSNGVKRHITLDEENGAIKVEGNFYSTGESAAGNAGEHVGTSECVVPNINVNVAALHLYNGRSINADDMEALTGLSVEIAELGAYFSPNVINDPPKKAFAFQKRDPLVFSVSYPQVVIIAPEVLNNLPAGFFDW